MHPQRPKPKQSRLQRRSGGEAGERKGATATVRPSPLSPRPSSLSPRKRLFILDDHPMFREGLAQLINNDDGLEVCGEAGTSLEALGVLPSLNPDLVLADISLPDQNGLEFIKNARSLLPSLPVLVISMHDEAIYAERVLRAGGRGYLMKQEGGKKLLVAIRQVLAGQIYVSESMSSRLLESFGRETDAPGRTTVEHLSDRELEVLQLIGQGRNNTEISTQLHLSPKTLEVHRANIRRKLALKDAADLLRYAVLWVETQS
ncbi:MAG: DNA-binding response regulator [Verrucomicrobia bacterium]|nr:MAG: DNA-binding response regulator [Verrucomicrobiota bacterium]